MSCSSYSVKDSDWYTLKMSQGHVLGENICLSQIFRFWASSILYFFAVFLESPFDLYPLSQTNEPNPCRKRSVLEVFAFNEWSEHLRKYRGQFVNWSLYRFWLTFRCTSFGSIIWFLFGLYHCRLSYNCCNSTYRNLVIVVISKTCLRASGIAYINL